MRRVQERTELLRTCFRRSWSSPGGFTGRASLPDRRTQSPNAIAKSCLVLISHGALFHDSDAQAGDRDGVLGLPCIGENISALKTMCWRFYSTHRLTPTTFCAQIGNTHRGSLQTARSCCWPLTAVSEQQLSLSGTILHCLLPPAF